MACGVKWQQVGRLDKALRKLRGAGFGAGSDVYDQIYAVRGRIMSQVGFKFPRSALRLLALVGLSPGKLNLFLDIEAGFFTVARTDKNAQPVTRYVSDDVAMDLLRGRMTHDLFLELAAPETYYGE